MGETGTIHLNLDYIQSFKNLNILNDEVLKKLVNSIKLELKRMSSNFIVNVKESSDSQKFFENYLGFERIYSWKEEHHAISSYLIF